MALLAPAGCADRGAPAGSDEPFARIFLVTIDTLRADHVGFHGYPRPTSPFLDELASRGLRFSRAFSAMPTTAPAHASMLSAMHPFEHGLLKNGQALDPRFVTFSDLLRPLGFQSAAFTSVNFLGWGLQQEFDHFDSGVEGSTKYRDATGTLDAALAWLEQRAPDDRLFVWIHLFDPHEHWADTPAPSEDLEALALGAGPEHQAALDFIAERHHLPRKQLQPRHPLLQRIARYDAQIRFADRELRRAYRRLEARGLTANSLWILTSDHGEGLGSHGYLLHGRYLWNEHLHVPLVFFSPRPGFPQREISSLVSHVDLLPTVAEWMGLALEPAGYTPSGRSLLPLIRGESGEAPRHAFSQRRPKDDDRPSFEDGDLLAIQDQRFKVVYRSNAATEFYDLLEDPLELDDRSAKGSPEQQRLRRLIDERITPRFHRPVFARGRELPLDEDLRRELEALGYIE